ncbi:Phosphoglycerate mutase family [Mycena venus]|uniref:Phosphoglycerate mutase family n=1 Tax=Mycena venus TaxID=2733690 RepID=A0A8H6YD82_9AGAR|nr:Phosphoglycerate mutase family [Mycena venus]
MLITLLSILALLFATVSSISINNTLYIITNAERPSLRRPGLSPIGMERAESCIPAVFHALNIGLIVVCTPDIKTNACIPANTTAAPLAASLGLVPDTSCGTGDDAEDDCVGDLLKKYAKHNIQSILIVWDSNETDDLLENLDLELPESDDDDDSGEDDEDDLAIYADIILIKNKKKSLVESSMNCTGIDGQAPGSFPRPPGIPPP